LLSIQGVLEVDNWLFNGAREEEEKVIREG
jgi:hypothetical protein